MTETVAPLYQTFREYLRTEVPVALATVVAGPHSVGDKLLVRLGGQTDGEIEPSELQRRVAGDAVRLLRAESPETQSYEMGDAVFEVFVDVFPAPPQLIIVGASHAALPLCNFAKALGFRVIITDARAAFAQSERFPLADRVIKGWPQDVFPDLRCDESTYVVLLSHDPKFDGPTLAHVLPTPVPYIGAIGSRKTQRERFARLRADGFTDVQLGRIYGPVGLDIGSRTVEETALAILAEVTAVRRGKEGGSMRRHMDSI